MGHAFRQISNKPWIILSFFVPFLSDFKIATCPLLLKNFADVTFDFSQLFNVKKRPYNRVAAFSAMVIVDFAIVVSYEYLQ